MLTFVGLVLLIVLVLLAISWGFPAASDHALKGAVLFLLVAVVLMAYGKT